MLRSSDFDNIGKLVLRLTIAGLMLLHGIDKVRNGIGGIEGLVVAKGLPGFVAYGAIVGEFVAPLFIIAGFRARLAALVLAFNMVVAIGLAHMGDVFSIGGHGQWAIEAPGLYLLGGVAIFFLGAGGFSVSRGAGRWD